MQSIFRHAIITGGSSGIGKAIAQHLVRQGSHVSIIARDLDKLTQAKAVIEQNRVYPTQSVSIISADVADRLQSENAIQAAIGQLGVPDLLITCAGIACPGYFLEIPVEVFERTMAVNYFGSLYCIRAVLPAMLSQRRGYISMVASGAGLIGISGYSTYCPSKFALRGLAETLRGELKPDGIRVSIVYPPDTDTPQLAEELKTKPLETQAITATAQLWQADEVAREILRGIHRKTFAITPGLEMTLLSRWHSVLFPALNRYFDRLIAQHRSSSSPRGL